MYSVKEGANTYNFSHFLTKSFYVQFPHLLVLIVILLPVIDSKLYGFKLVTKLPVPSILRDPVCKV